MLYDPNLPRQHAGVQPEPPADEPIHLEPVHVHVAPSLRNTILYVLAIVVLMAIAHKIDTAAEADDAAARERLDAELALKRDERMWAHRMAVAYQRGLEDGASDVSRLQAHCDTGLRPRSAQ